MQLITNKQTKNSPSITGSNTSQRKRAQNKIEKQNCFKIILRQGKAWQLRSHPLMNSKGLKPQTTWLQWSMRLSGPLEKGDSACHKVKLRGTWIQLNLGCGLSLQPGNCELSTELEETMTMPDALCSSTLQRHPRSRRTSPLPILITRGHQS